MSTGLIIQTLCEAVAIGFIVWGILNEKKLVNFENMISAFFRRRRLKAVKVSHVYNKKHCA